MSKLDKLNELKALLDSGTLTQEEFENLKQEILSKNESNTALDSNQNTKESSVTEHRTPLTDSNKVQISLKSFTDYNGKRIKAPDLEYINFNDISKEEKKQLKPFLIAKHVSDPAAMTQDEIDLGNKLFTLIEIAHAESERPGFNHAVPAILSPLVTGVALFFLTISPCMLIFCGSGLIAGIVIAFTVLNKANATKLDRIFAGIALVLGAIAIIVYITGWE